MVGRHRPDLGGLAPSASAGQSIAISGIPWWTPTSADSTEGIRKTRNIKSCSSAGSSSEPCSLFRLHGHREPREAVGAVSPGGLNEIWSYGDEAFAIAKDHILLRERLRPYIDGPMEEAAETGIPDALALHRVPEDPPPGMSRTNSSSGPMSSCAPSRSRERLAHGCICLPERQWRDAYTDQVHDGGQTVEIEAPLERTPFSSGRAPPFPSETTIPSHSPHFIRRSRKHVSDQHARGRVTALGALPCHSHSS